MGAYQRNELKHLSEEEPVQWTVLIPCFPQVKHDDAKVSLERPIDVHGKIVLKWI
jgi:hypothetical protein